MIEIKNKWTGEVIFTFVGDSLIDANLIGANLRGANLRGANLEGANLRGANLEAANLIGANLIDANLIGANLRGANLRGANLEGANLIGANLIDANLIGANLIDANLIGANLRGANLRGANLRGANLRGAKGFEFITPIPNLKQIVRERVEANPEALDMGTWHACETTHCLAGWGVHVAGGEGRILEKLLSTQVAATLIWQVSHGSVPNFYSSNEEALEWLRAE